LHHAGYFGCCISSLNLKYESCLNLEFENRNERGNKNNKGEKEKSRLRPLLTKPSPAISEDQAHVAAGADLWAMPASLQLRACLGAPTCGARSSAILFAPSLLVLLPREAVAPALLESMAPRATNL
jgi:hypothetical protein